MDVRKPKAARLEQAVPLLATPSSTPSVTPPEAPAGTPSATTAQAMSAAEALRPRAHTLPLAAPTPISHVQQFKLILVDFKEAALDLPSFRASVNHLDAQVDNIEKWLLAIVSTMLKFPKYISELQTFSDSFLEHLLPTFLQDGLLDQEYTVQALQTVCGGMHKLWGTALASLSVETQVAERLKSVVTNDITKYKRLRRRFDKCQQKYDRYLAIYQATPKAKGPNIVMEDANQLFAVRQEYVRLSIDLTVELTSLGNALDRVFVRLASNLWSSKQAIFDNFNAASKFYTDLVSKVRRIQGWCDSNTVATRKLERDMQTARLQVEQLTNTQYRPLGNPNDYRASLINQTTLQEIDEPATEKHGYVFMKLWRSGRLARRRHSTERPLSGGIDSGDDFSNDTIDEEDLRQVWVKRWAFIKGGVFGLLNLSPLSSYVQESDKIGLLVCNVKYAPYEDRRNCFELKTVDATYIFQCETVLELKSWLMVFANEKNRVLHATNNDHLLKIALGRYPPIIKELACTINTVTDQQMTSSRVVNKLGQIITPSRLLTHIERHERDFQRHVYYELLQIRPPFITDLTKLAILAYSLVEATSLPTALTANIWGSINWGLYYLHDTLTYTAPAGAGAGETAGGTADDGARAPPADASHAFLPEGYPSSMVAKNIQMRAIFETLIEPNEYCLLLFRSIWSPNLRQELGGRCFITAKHVYVYMNALGFIALFKGSVNSLVLIDYVKQDDHDLIKLYNINGVIKMKLFLDDAKTICQKVLYLIENKAKDVPDTAAQLVRQMERIDSQRRSEMMQEEDETLAATKAQAVARARLQTGARPPVAPPAALLIPAAADAVTARSFRVDFRDEALLMGSGRFNVPPKALFHALLGDNSLVLNHMQLLATLKSIVKKPWNTEGGLHRKLKVVLVLPLGKEHPIEIEQRVEHMDEAYYNVTHTKSRFRFTLGGVFRLKFRIVIYQEARGKLRVLVYGKPQFEKSLPLMAALTRILCNRICVTEARLLLRSLRDAERLIGTHGMVVKAIYLFGKLSKAQYADDRDEVPVTRIRFTTVSMMLFTRVLLYVLRHVSEGVHYVVFAVVALARALRMNVVLVAFLAASVAVNVFLAARSTTSFWTVQRVLKMAHEFLTSDPWMILRAVYLRDTEELLRRRAPHFNASRCFDTFKLVSFLLNPDKTSFWDSEYADPRTREVAQRLKRSAQDIAIKRNELLTHLSMLNHMEEEVALGEWRNWLHSEVERCDLVMGRVLEIDAMDAGAESLIAYCRSCNEELRHAGLL